MSSVAFTEATSDCQYKTSRGTVNPVTPETPQYYIVLSLVASSLAQCAQGMLICAVFCGFLLYSKSSAGVTFVISEKREAKCWRSDQLYSLRACSATRSVYNGRGAIQSMMPSTSVTYKDLSP